VSSRLTGWEGSVNWQGDLHEMAVAGIIGGTAYRSIPTRLHVDRADLIGAWQEGIWKTKSICDDTFEH
jgi:hypothetical protein